MIGVWLIYKSTIDWDHVDFSSPDAPGWRIEWDMEPDEAEHHEWWDRTWLHTFCFARRVDAEAALKALEAAGYSLDDFRKMPTEGEWDGDQIMLNAMQW